MAININLLFHKKLKPQRTNSDRPAIPAVSSDMAGLRREFDNWILKGGPAPADHKAKIASNGSMYLTRIAGFNIYLRGPKGAERKVLLKFSEESGRKTVHIFEEDGRTFMRSYLFCKGEDGRWKISMQNNARNDLAGLRKEIDNWVFTGGPVPADHKAKITLNGSVYLTRIAEFPIYLKGLKGSERPALLKFSEEGGEKRVDVFEEDGQTLVRGYVFKKGEDGRWRMPVRGETKWNQAMVHRQAVLDWLLKNGSAPSALRIKIRGGAAYFSRLDGQDIFLTCLGSSGREGILRYKDEEGKKLIEVYESDSITLIRAFKLIRSTKGAWGVVPVHLSDRQRSIAYGDEMLCWLDGQAPPPAAFTRMVNAGKNISIGINGKKLFVCLNLAEKTEVTLEPYEEEGGKRLRACAADKTILKVLRFEKDQTGEWGARVLGSDFYSSKTYGDSLRQWAKGEGEAPPEKSWKVKRGGGVSLFLINGSRVYVTGLIGMARAIIKPTDGEKGEKLFRVSDEAGNGTVMTFKLVDMGAGKWGTKCVDAYSRSNSRQQNDEMRSWIDNKTAGPIKIKKPYWISYPDFIAFD